MALKQTMAFSGLQIPDAYLRLARVEVKGKTEMFAVLSVQVAAGSPSIFFTGYDCPYDLAGDNPLAQAYSHLKTLPDFATAVDA